MGFITDFLGITGGNDPDPIELTQAQSAANVETAIAQALLNQQQQVTPFGSTEFKQIGSTLIPGTNIRIPRFEQVQTLSPLGQEQFETQQRIGGLLSGLAESNIGNVQQAQAQPFSFEGLPEIGDFSQQGAEIERATFDRALGLLNPEFARERERLDINLAERGLPLGSQASESVIDPFERRKNEALQQAAFQAVGAGRAEQDRLLANALASRQQGIQERAFERSLPINEIATLLGTAPGVATPQFNPFTPTGVAGTDVIGANLGAADIAQQRRSALLGGLFDLGTAAIAFSDERLKENIEHIGYLNDHKLYKYNYIWSDEEVYGVMAQEVEKDLPEAVFEVAGYKAVNYDMVM